MDIEDYIKRMEEDIKELKSDMKVVLAHIAVAKDHASKKTMIYSGLISLAIGLIMLGVKEFL